MVRAAAAPVPSAGASRAALAWPLALGALVLLTRAPLLAHGFGSDDDAWRNAVAALHMHAAGRYVPSRVPGFPVYEALLFVLVPLGSLATNAASVLAQLAAVLLLWDVARRLGLRAPGAVAAVFALAPALWVDASQTMDYATTLALTLGAYDLLLRRRWAAAGALLALAAGSRASTGLLIAPALLAAALAARSWRAPLALGAAFAVALAAVFAPVALAPEVRDLGGQFAGHVAHHHLALARVPAVARGSAVVLCGRLGTLALLLALALGLRRRAPRDAVAPGVDARAALAFEAGGALTVAAFFALIPYDALYLLPALPLGLLLLARVAGARALALAALVMAAEALVTPSFGARQLTPGRLPAELATRAADLAATRAALAPGDGAREVRVVGRYRVLRLVALAPSLERTDAAWAPFDAPGVALWSAGRRTGWAGRLTAADRAALAAAGYAVRDAAP